MSIERIKSLIQEGKSSYQVAELLGTAQANVIRWAKKADLHFIRKRRPLRSCEHCGEDLNEHQFKYCSNQCQRDYEWAQVKRRIEGGHMQGISDRSLKRYLLEAGHACSICHNTEWFGQPIPLELDHINGHSEQNDLKNLRLVCGNCAMLLPTYKGKNAGNGRHSRRERYRNGKSY